MAETDSELISIVGGAARTGHASLERDCPLLVYAVTIALSPDGERAERAAPIVSDLLSTLRSLLTGGKQ